MGADSDYSCNSQTMRSGRIVVVVPFRFLAIVLALIIFTSLVADAHVNFSPISLGIRSALFNGPVLRRYRSSRSTTVIKTSTSLLDCDVEAIDDDTNHDRIVGSAFLKIKSRQNKVDQQAAQSALLTKIQIPLALRIQERCTTELDFLEQGSLFVDKKTIDSFSTSKYSHHRMSSSDLCENLSCSSRAVVNPSHATVPKSPRPLVFWENMICGAISRSIAQTLMHPANTMKTILQNTRRGLPDSPTIGELMLPRNFRRLTVGAGANFLLSVPHGAVNFAVLELVRKRLSGIVQSNPFLAANESKLSFGLDFLSSSISTVACSVVSTPQMMITDNIMAGNYPNLKAACIGLAKTKGINGFYAGWWPGLVGKIPSYAFTWTFFQQLKKFRSSISARPDATDAENSIMGCIASATTVCLMIPMDTIKTRRTFLPILFSVEMNDEPLS